MIKKVLDVTKLDQEKLNEIDIFIAGVENKEEDIIKILHGAQQIYGYLPKALQLYIARAVNLTAAKINGIVSFYSFFSQEPKGDYSISVCMGTACFVKDADIILKKFQKELDLDNSNTTTMDGKFSIRDVRCIGACGLAPVVTVNDKIYGHVSSEEQVFEIIDFYQKKEKSDD